MEPFRFRAGTTPLLVSMPHAGTRIPEDLAQRMTPVGRRVADTDWHVDRLYDFVEELGATTIAADFSRYVVDLNRPPDGHNLYPGQNTPGLVPLHTFAGEDIYASGEAPGHEEIEQRVAQFWRPYHDRLASTLGELREKHGVALLWEAHTIRSEVPRLFEGRLSDLNLGTNGGASCAPELADALMEIASRSEGYTAVLNGRFKGGHITRHYGNPEQRVHAVQLELVQATYMDEEDVEGFGYLEHEASRIRLVLAELVRAFLRSAGRSRAP